jgi:peroxiredoxin
LLIALKNRIIQIQIIMIVKKIFYTAFIFFIFFSCAIAKKGHQIQVEVDGVQDTIAYLAYHMGNRQYLQDSARVDSKGNFSFKGEESLPKGIYMVVLPGQIYFELLVDDNQHFGIKTENDNFVNTMKFTKSPDNEVFYNYMRFIRSQGEKTTPLREKMQNPETTEEERAQIRAQMALVDQQVKQEQEKIISNSPNGLFSKILLAQQEPALPDPPLKEDGSPDNEYMYQLYKKLFWENIDFSDERLVRTPILHAKLNQYFTRVIIQIPDSIIAEADRIVNKARASKEVFKYTVFYITNTFERSQIMGMEAVFVHMVEKYYLTGKADWITEEQLKSISERAMILKPLLIGKVAPDITVFTREHRTRNLHDVKADFTVLYFWDSECSHCKKNTPLLKEMYARMKGQNVEIFALNTESDRTKWLEYVDNNNLQWINVYDPGNQSGFRDKYDIWATPLIFLLDKDKRIIAKKITVEQTEEIINMEIKRLQR